MSSKREALASPPRRRRAADTAITILLTHFHSPPPPRAVLVTTAHVFVPALQPVDVPSNTALLQGTIHTVIGGINARGDCYRAYYFNDT